MKTFKICLLGTTNVGKTLLHDILTSNHILNYDYKPTIGVNMRTSHMKINNKIRYIHIYDIGGLKRFNSYIPRYIEISDIIIFVYSLTDYNSFEYVKKIYNYNTTILKNKHIIFVGNMKDLDSYVYLNLNEFFQDKNIKNIKISAKTLENINLIYDHIRYIISNNENNNISYRNFCDIL